MLLEKTNLSLFWEGFLLSHKSGIEKWGFHL